ncbi:MAG TPA: hypothetical protein VK165_01565 [Azonexus sp.]|nr:hypothetical protein [Azonexus sp.]
MSGSMFTVEQKREHVLAYLAAPYGSRGRYLGEHGVSYRQFRVWRAQVFADTLEYGLVPRGGLAVTAEQSAFVARLRAELDALREQVAQQQAEHEQALAAKAAELAVQVKAVDALGKAIEILHHAGAGKSSQPQDRAEGQRP